MVGRKVAGRGSRAVSSVILGALLPLLNPSCVLHATPLSQVSACVNEYPRRQHAVLRGVYTFTSYLASRNVDWTLCEGDNQLVPSLITRTRVCTYPVMCDTNTHILTLQIVAISIRVFSRLRHSSLSQSARGDVSSCGCPTSTQLHNVENGSTDTSTYLRSPLGLLLISRPCR